MFLAKNLHAGYGRMTVLRDVSLSVAPGEIVLVLGPNGAGKSTLMRALSGLIPLQQGQLELQGNVVTGRSVEQLAQRGLRHVLEGHRVFPGLSVQDNVRLGQIARRRADRLPDADILERAFEMFPILGEKRRLLARSLSGGQQQMLALVQAWAAQPSFLLCDEPSLGLAQSLIPEILRFFQQRASEGMGIVLVEQLIEQPLRVADTVVVLRQGQVVGQGKADGFTDAAAVAELMLGDRL
ncbi:MAG: transporter ATP-binding protein [Sphaerisporangium sp.]|jgi:branched-chain amino acid transport system ATP-binding protein|nr:transporter ATP-binding protein [Sphaerisporangium sp.]